MALFSNFCNICYEIDNGSLQDTSEENMKHLNDILITFVGHADIIKFNVIYLCQLCCEELTRFDKFREICLTNLIQLRQRYINVKLELEDNACAVRSTLQNFVYEEVMRKSALEKSNCPVSISTECHEIIKSHVDLNKDCLVFNKQLTNMQLETNECEFDGACSEVSRINSVTDCDESRVAVTKEEDMKNEILRHSENTSLEIFEGKYEEGFNVSDANNDNESDSLQIEYMKEEYNLKSERENSDSENLTLKNYENESDEQANPDVKIPVGYNSGGSVSSGIASTKEELNVKQENSAAKGLELQTTADEFGDVPNFAFQIANVRTIVNMEERGHRMKLRNRDSNSKLAAAIIDAQPNRLHMREYHNRICRKTLQSDVHNQVYPSVEAHNCEVCTKSFRTRACLTGHAHTHNYVYECTVCSKMFRNLSNLNAHERIHSGVRPHKCTVCNKTFTQSGTLTVHRRIHSGARPYKCTVCKRPFAHKTSLTSHERTHSGEKPYKCTICNKAFAHSNNLTTHKLIHSGARPYKCSVCNKTFTQSGTLTIHERTHSGEKPYKCTICKKTFTRTGTLTVHERTHSGEKPYKCTICNKAFAHSCSLTTHEFIHSGEKPYKCTVCAKAFATSSCLIVHKRLHTGARPYNCTVCKKTFTQSGTLTVHERTHSGFRPYKCTVCKKPFAHKSSLTSHARTHSGEKS